MLTQSYLHLSLKQEKILEKNMLRKYFHENVLHPF